MGYGGYLFPLQLPQPFFDFTQLSRIHFKQWGYLPQIQMLLLSKCSYFLTKLAFHRLFIDLSNIVKYKQIKERVYQLILQHCKACKPHPNPLQKEREKENKKP